MAKREILVYPDLEDLSRNVAEEFVRLVEQAVRSSGRFTVALSGGETPQRLYQLLPEAAYSERVPWKSVHFFWGDERCVPPEHSESNYRMARELLLARIPVPEENVRRMAGEKQPQVAAAEYEQTLIDFFRLTPGEWPRFDLMLMGIGEDGHTASLFPENDALRNQEKLVLAPYVEKLKAHRLTLILPVINHAANIWFLVSGASKATVMTEIFKANSGTPRIPATLVKPVDGSMTWFITEDAAAAPPA
jgi:6-phosphogluconolactonase